MPEHLSEQYRTLKALASADVSGRPMALLISEMALYARELLERMERVQLVSRVEGKHYFSLRGNAQSRPLNEALYVVDQNEFEGLLRDIL